MKAISIYAPWPHLIFGCDFQLPTPPGDSCISHRIRVFKTIETRTWYTRYRGDLIICVAKTKTSEFANASMICDGLHYPSSCIGPIADQLPYDNRGYAIGIVELFDCRMMEKKDEECACCGYYPGLWAHCYRNARRIKPFQVKGQRMIFDADVSKKNLVIL